MACAAIMRRARRFEISSAETNALEARVSKTHKQTHYSLGHLIPIGNPTVTGTRTSSFNRRENPPINEFPPNSRQGSACRRCGRLLNKIDSLRGLFFRRGQLVASERLDLGRSPLSLWARFGSRRN